MKVSKNYLKNKYVRLCKAYIMHEHEKMPMSADGDDFTFTPEDAVKLMVQERIQSIFEAVGKLKSNEIDITEILFPKGSPMQISVIMAVIMNEDFNEDSDLNPDEYSIHYILKSSPYGFSIKEYRVSSVVIRVDLQSQLVDDIEIVWEMIDPKEL